jgi:endogenous inhibitor of DNA gyrase (YacG/DUF329 family)
MSEQRPELVPFVTRADSTSDVTAFDCPLCGGRFSHGTLVCGSCPLNAGCEIVKCPSCGYQFPRRSRIVEFARRVFGSGNRG